MSIEQNKAIARRFVQLWGDGSLDIIDELAGPSFSVYYPVLPKVIQGGETFKKAIRSFRSVFSKSACEIEEEIAENDKVVVRWRYSGIHKGRFLGFAGTNKVVNWTGITIYRIVAGKVVEERGEEDYLGFLRRICAVPRA